MNDPAWISALAAVGVLILSGLVLFVRVVMILATMQVVQRNQTEAVGQLREAVDKTAAQVTRAHRRIDQVMRRTQ